MSLSKKVVSRRDTLLSPHLKKCISHLMLTRHRSAKIFHSSRWRWACKLTLSNIDASVSRRTRGVPVAFSGARVAVVQTVALAVVGKPLFTRRAIVRGALPVSCAHAAAAVGHGSLGAIAARCAPLRLTILPAVSCLAYAREVSTPIGGNARTSWRTRTVLGVCTGISGARIGLGNTVALAVVGKPLFTRRAIVRGALPVSCAHAAAAVGHGSLGAIAARCAPLRLTILPAVSCLAYAREVSASI